MKKHGKGLTLVEVLVVIAIVIAVATIAFPVYGGVKRSVQITVHTNNLRQIATALHLYSEENEGKGSLYYWPDSLTMLDLPKSILKCPSGSEPGGTQFWFFAYKSPMWYQHLSTDPNPVLVGSTCFDPNARQFTNPNVTHLGIGVYLDGHVSKIQKKGQVYDFEFWSE